MESFFSRFKNSLVLMALLLAQTIGLAIQVRRPIETGAADSPRVTLVRSWVVALITPAERLFWNLGHTVRSTWGNYVDLRDVRQHNRDLQYQIDQLRIQQAAIAEDAVQAHRLQALLAFQQHYISATVAAQVIGTGGSDLSRVLYIDKGAADGLKPDMPVITPDGIVGKVRDVFDKTAPHTAQVLLINDPTSGAGVILANTRVRAIIRGTTGGRVEIGNLTPDDRIKPGEPVLTSGGDQVFPRGLPVGTVESISPDPEHQPYTAIRVKPAVNLFQLEEVLIITGSQNSLPPATLQSLARGAELSVAARAAAQKAAAIAAARAAADEKEAAARSASDLVADRLPGLNDPAADPNSPEAKARAAAIAANPKAAIPAIPRPLPTVHPDRFSPGTTPPAGALIPGAPHARSVPSSPADRPPAPDAALGPVVTPPLPRTTTAPHTSPATTPARTTTTPTRTSPATNPARTTTTAPHTSSAPTPARTTTTVPHTSSATTPARATTTPRTSPATRPARTTTTTPRASTATIAPRKGTGSTHPTPPTTSPRTRETNAIAAPTATYYGPDGKPRSPAATPRPAPQTQPATTPPQP